MKINQLKWGSLLSYSQMILQVIISIVYTPVMLRLLGQSEYGLYNTVSSTMSMLSILSLGFTSSYIRFYSKYKAEQKEKEIQKLNGLFLLIFIFIGFIALLCGFFLSDNLTFVFADGLTSEEYVTAKKLMIILAINLALSFPTSVFQTIISAHEKYFFLKVLSVINTILSPMITLPMLLMGYRSTALAVTRLLLEILLYVLYFAYAKGKLKASFYFKGFDIELFKSLFGFTFFIALELIVNQINNNVDKFLLGRFCGTEIVAVYSIASTLYIHYMLISLAISNVFTPRVHQIVNQTQIGALVKQKEITDLFTRVGRIQFIIISLVATGFIFFGKPFIFLWAGHNYEESYYIALLLMLPISVDLIQNIGIEVQRAMNKHRFRSIIYIIMALINLTLSIFLCQKYGAIGAAFGTAISVIIANGIIMNISFYKHCKIDIGYFWKNILRMTLALIPSIICGVIINRFDINGILSLILGIIIYTIVFCLSMWLLAMNSYEKNLIIKPIKKLLKK